MSPTGPPAGPHSRRASQSLGDLAGAEHPSAGARVIARLRAKREGRDSFRTTQPSIGSWSRCWSLTAEKLAGEPLRPSARDEDRSEAGLTCSSASAGWRLQSEAAAVEANETPAFRPKQQRERRPPTRQHPGENGTVRSVGLPVVELLRWGLAPAAR
jgi:hypothetical protein